MKKNNLQVLSFICLIINPALMQGLFVKTAQKARIAQARATRTPRIIAQRMRFYT